MVPLLKQPRMTAAAIPLDSGEMTAIVGRVLVGRSADVALPLQERTAGPGHEVSGEKFAGILVGAANRRLRFRLGCGPSGALG
jgi:hypothetical protein